jgi:hypothetical protein
LTANGIKLMLRGRGREAGVSEEIGRNLHAHLGRHFQSHHFLELVSCGVFSEVFPAGQAGSEGEEGEDVVGFGFVAQGQAPVSGEPGPWFAR